MEALGVPRKLTAILSTNVVGDALTMPLVEAYRGRVIEASGPVLRAEFSRVVDAVECAAVIQKVLKARNDRLPLPRRLPFRIGIELGDAAGHRVSPDGHPLAARLEALADPGEICISGSAYDQIENERQVGGDAAGTVTGSFGQTLRVHRAVAAAPPPVDASARKAAPLRLVDATTEWDAAGPGFDHAAPDPLEARSIVAPRGSSRRRVGLVAAALMIVVGGGGFAAWQLAGSTATSPAVTAVDRRPSLVMLPIVNVSGDPRGEGVAAAVDAGVRATLARLSGLTTSMASADVRYVLDGSVRLVDGRVRFIATLVDTMTGHAVGGNHFDRAVVDVGAVQSDLVQWIIAALSIPVTADEKAAPVAGPASASTVNAATTDTRAAATPAASATVPGATASTRATPATSAPTATAPASASSPPRVANRSTLRAPGPAKAEPPPATILEHPRESPAASPSEPEPIKPTVVTRDDTPRVAPPPAALPAPRTPPARSAPPAAERPIPHQAN